MQPELRRRVLAEQHPAPRARDLKEGFVERAVYPDRATSRRLAWRNLAFPWLNPRSLVLPALLYALSAWFASASLGQADLASLGATVAASLGAALRDPVNGLWLLAVVATFVFMCIPDHAQLAALRELGRVCRRDGEIRLVDYRMSQKPLVRVGMRVMAPWLKFTFAGTYDARTEAYFDAAGLKCVSESNLFGDVVKMHVLRPL